jgi:AbrB family looped-hinge helix DNA binding protein
MTVLVKSKTELVVPRSVRREAGIKSGDRLEFRVSGGIINIVPQLPSTADEYTPAQRRAIDAQLADARKRPIHGPFDSAGEMNAHIKGELKKRAAAKKPATRPR